ncbi:MAG: hypothetical protein AB7Y46_10705 [Armatimonadota bacterium]
MSSDRWPVAAALGLVLAVAPPCAAQNAGPLIYLDLPTAGPQYSLGMWLQATLLQEGMAVSWPQAGDESRSGDEPACVVAWSAPGRAGMTARELRAHVRDGGGLVYVVGASERHVREARALLGPLGVNVEATDGISGYARWVEHPLTEGAGEIGAVTPSATISGVGGSPLAELNGQPVAIVFDWGPLGRAVILDSSLLFDQLHQDSPRPTLRELLVGAVRWAAGAEEYEAPEVAPPGAQATPAEALPWREGLRWAELPEPRQVGPPVHRSALLDVPGSEDGWPQIRELLVRELEHADLEVSAAAPEGEPRITAEALETSGLLVVGSGREEVHWTEPIAVERFVEDGGRALFIAHASAKTQKRMIGFNQLMTGLGIAASLSRHSGFVVLRPHRITEGLRVPADVRIRRGAQVWAPLTDTLAEISDRPVAVAWHSEGGGRAVVLDGELLRAPERQERPLDALRELLRRAIQWLLGEL